MTVIDLRSDTVTKPSPEMRRAMAEAEVGDDVLDGDPTTRRLEERVAALIGMEAALFFPSGTQANQTGIALLTRPGTELVLEANAHLVHYELAGPAVISGVQIRPVRRRGAGCRFTWMAAVSGTPRRRSASRPPASRRAPPQSW